MFPPAWARAARVLAVAVRRADAELARDASENDESVAPSRGAARIEVCTNNACAKKGGKALLTALQAMAEENQKDGLRVECRRSRCVDACALACVVRVDGVFGRETHELVGADEAKEIFELATGSSPGEYE